MSKVIQALEQRQMRAVDRHGRITRKPHLSRRLGSQRDRRRFSPTAVKNDGLMLPLTIGQHQRVARLCRSRRGRDLRGGGDGMLRGKGPQRCCHDDDPGEECGTGEDHNEGQWIILTRAARARRGS